MQHPPLSCVDAPIPRLEGDSVLVECRPERAAIRRVLQKKLSVCRFSEYSFDVWIETLLGQGPRSLIAAIGEKPRCNSLCSLHPTHPHGQPVHPARSMWNR